MNFHKFGLISVSVAFAAVTSSRSPIAGATTPVVEQLSDGTELVVLSIPDATEVSMRYVVHSGSLADPVDREGLAHVLEHVIFHGGHDVPGRALAEEARATGVHVNAFTGPEQTVFVADGARSAVLAFLPRYLGVLTSPALGGGRLDAELGVVSAEASLRREGSASLMTQLLLPGLRGRSMVIGTERSRTRLRRRDLVGFYGDHYRPSNTTIVFTGAIDAATARALVESSSRLAPSPPRDARFDVEETSLSVPVHAKVRAPLFFVLLGYEVSGVSRSVCRELASLVEVRLLASSELGVGAAGVSSTDCVVLAGRQLLVAMLAHRSAEGSQLSPLIDRVFRSVSERRITPAERAHLVARAQMDERRLRADPTELADRVAADLSGSGSPAERQALLAELSEAPRLDAAELQKIAKGFFVESRQVRIDVAPF
ncbi:insulinase family protein [Myxococcota bacterium]|nr:insulinase family protein [Myxococcota bacterium]